jgi:integrase
VIFDARAREWMANRSLRPRTRETYDSQLRHILAQFGRAELREIKPGDVRNWHGRLAKSGLSPNTTAKVYRMFRTIMSTAVDDGLIRSNPVAIRGAAVESTIERPLLTWDDIDRLARAIEPRFSALVWVAATSALRFGELTGLDRSRVDLESGTIRVDRALAFQKGEGPTLGPPKSDAAYRVVALPATVTDLLRTHLAEYTDAAPGSLVFTSVQGSPLLNCPTTSTRRHCSDADTDTTTASNSPARSPKPKAVDSYLSDDNRPPSHSSCSRQTDRRARSRSNGRAWTLLSIIQPGNAKNRLIAR